SKGNEFEDNDERAIFFARGVLETVKKLRWMPDIVHCHGWMSSLVPVYLRQVYNDDPIFSDVKIVYSLYNNGFNKPFRDTFIDKIVADGIDRAVLAEGTVPDFYNISKLAIDYSDGTIIGSKEVDGEVEKYIKSIDKPWLGYSGEEDYVDAYNDFYDKLV
ncbi:MAG: glycogen/starch synthase, partial [Bacteroidales bacterium]